MRCRNSGEVVCDESDGEGDDEEEELLLLLVVLLWAARIAEEKSEGGGEREGSRHGGLRRFSSPKMSRTVASLLTCFFRETSDSGSLSPPTSGTPEPSSSGL